MYSELSLDNVNKIDYYYEKYTQSHKIQIDVYKYREMFVYAYEQKRVSWSDCWKTLYNAGFRGPVDKHGFPTRFIK